MTQQDFKTLFDRYFDPLRNYVFFRSGNKETATDIAQECFLRLWEKRDHQPVKKQVALLYKMAGDMFISHYRHLKVEQEFATNNPGINHAPSPEDELNYDELNIRYIQALEAMPQNLRVVFLMSREEDLKNREIAVRLGLGVKAVEKRMTGALKYLREALTD